MALNSIPIGVPVNVLSGVVYATPAVPSILTTGAPVDVGPTITGPWAAFQAGAYLELEFFRPTANTVVSFAKVNTTKKPYAGETYANRIIRDGASYYWRLGESSGLVAVDSVGGVNGTISGGVTLAQPGAISDGTKAMTFDGVDDKITTAAAVALLTPCTVELWFKVASVVNGVALLSNRTGYPTANILLLQLQQANGWATIVLDYANATSPEQTFTAGVVNCADGQWHHLLAVVTALNVDLYFDGAFAAPSHPLPASFAGSSVVLDLGRDIFNGFGACSLDEVAIYPRALTPAEILAHYNLKAAPSSAPYSQVVLNDKPSNYWRLNELSGTTAADVVGGAHGTISGGVTLGAAGALSDDKGMTFNGTSGQIITPDVPLVKLPLTVEAWIKTSEVTERCYLTDFPGSQLYSGMSLGVMFYYGNGGAAAGITIINNSQWHHVVTIYTSTSIIFYVDGVFDKFTSIAVTPAIERWEIGNRNVNGFVNAWNGFIDEVAIYPYALSVAQIGAHYRARR